MITLTFEKTKELLAEAIAEKGAGYVYVNSNLGEDSLGHCSYVHTLENGELIPGCLVGDVLNRAGVQLEVLNLKHAGAAIVLSDLAYMGILEADTESHDLLWLAQGQQDKKVPWGEAVERALARQEAHPEMA